MALYVRPNMFNFDVGDFRERYSEEVMSFL